MAVSEHFGHQFWNLDIIGKEDDSKRNESEQCKVKTEAVKKFNDSISFEIFGKCGSIALET